MKKMNFNTLQTLPVPEQWIENALAIPEKERMAAPLWRRSRFIAAAASLLLVTALSIALYLSVGTQPPVAVKPRSSASEWATDENGATIVPEGVNLPDGTVPGSSNGVIVYPDGSTEYVTEDGFGSSVDPSEKGRPSLSANVKPTEKGGRQDPTTKPAPSEGGKPFVIPTLPLAEDPTGSPAVTEAPSPNETEPTFEEPTYAPDHTGPAGDPDMPTQPPWTPPSEGETWPPEYFKAIFDGIGKRDFDMVGKDFGTIYCSVYSADKSVMYGEKNRYSDQHKARITQNGRSAMRFSYDPAGLGILPGYGYYYYEFYDETGRILVTDYIYLSA